MTKKELSQLYYIEREKKTYQRELEKLELKSYINSPQITGMPISSDYGDKVSERAIRTEELKAIISKLESKAADEKCKIIRYISDIPDSIDRQIVICRCYSLMKWKEVADEIGGYNTEDNVRMRFNRLFKNEKIEQ